MTLVNDFYGAYEARECVMTRVQPSLQLPYIVQLWEPLWVAGFLNHRSVYTFMCIQSITTVSFAMSSAVFVMVGFVCTS